ncbi:MAG TPA: flavin reductase family protein [Alphaproteobacteria bacterium]|jgi:flavin reductase (DIM6/NTAB) family NADH-FMN oxidoreductase RutF
MIDAADLRLFAGHFATGVTVITTRDPSGGYCGLTMNAVSCVSLAPPMFLICVDERATTLKPLLDSGVFAINILAYDQDKVSNTFATKGENKFASVEYDTGLLDVPLIRGALAVAELKVAKQFVAGDHVIIVGEAQSTRVIESAPLLYYRGKYGMLHQS